MVAVWVLAKLHFRLERGYGASLEPLAQLELGGALSATLGDWARMIYS